MSSGKSVIRTHKYLLLALLVFGVIYSLISIVNHYNFRTYALDLGAYTNALFDYRHFRWNDCTVFNEVKQNLLADHFDLYLIIFSPLSFVFKSYTLLIVQIIFLLAGGIGVYKYFYSPGKKPGTALSAAICFYIFFGIYSALSFDYHSNVVAASMVPWFFFLLKRRKFVGAGLMLLFILISKENVALWLAFICLGLLAEYRKDPFMRKFLIFAFLFSAIYFILVISMVMPWFSNHNTYPHFHYSVLGNNMAEALIFLVKHPLDSITTLFVNHTHHPFGDFVKAEFHLLVLISGLPLLIFKPQYLLMLVPLYFQKMFHDNYVMWGIGGQYSIEFAPVLAIGIFSVIDGFERTRLRNILTAIVLIATLSVTIRVMDHTILFTDKSRIRIYKYSHYHRDYDVAFVHRALAMIPDDAVVSAQSPFLPHLALRESIYQFPYIRDAGYIILSAKEDTYPLNKTDFVIKMQELLNAKEWIPIVNNKDLLILKKILH